MKRFLKFDTEDAKNGIGPVDRNGVIKKDISGGGGTHPDWNQNDETQPDYVKNRPFYTYEAITKISPETTLKFNSDSISLIGGSTIDGLMSSITSNFNEASNVTYLIRWDGTLYNTSRRKTAIGNESIIGNGEDTGEPFAIVGIGAGQYKIYTKETSTEHTFSADIKTVTNIKIDEKYIPNCASIIDANNFPGMTFKEKQTIVSNFDNMQKPMYVLQNMSLCLIIDALSTSDDIIITSLGCKYNGYDTIPCFKKYSDKNGFEEFYPVLNNDSQFIMNSSTQGSTKKFKITVDDSGTITATEVT